MINERKNSAISVGGEAFTEALKNYGPTTVLEHLIWISSTRSDWVVDELVIMFPFVAATAEFFHRCKETFEMNTEVVLKKLKDDPNWLKSQGVLMI
jgi:hypothetical protein